jgi:redox-sensitive bicupin YhaK (pirin superfamily)
MDDKIIGAVIAGRLRSVGTSQVLRVLPVHDRRHLGPFVFLDHMGPVALAPGAGFDVRPHPHIGLSTLTYLFEGDGLHRDSLGTVQVIASGDVNLMTAGRGVVHSERSTDRSRASGGPHHGLQLWIALPEADEVGPPSFSHLSRADVPRLEREGVTASVILGEAWGIAARLRHPSAPLFVEARLAAGARLELPAAPELGIYVVAGCVRVGANDVVANTLAVVLPGATATMEALEESRVVLLGGPPFGERFIDWNFVSSSKERIDQAKADWRERRFPAIPGDDVEYESLPEARRAP